LNKTCAKNPKAGSFPIGRSFVKKSYATMKFAELTPGRSITVGPETITEAEIIAFARNYDPQWFHVDPERAAESVWRA
jgi:acyl dehydratase